jgi:hypothetical protein
MDNATSLSLARVAVGTAAWVAPEFSLKAGMLDHTAPQSPFMLRLFGVRDAALGAITLMAAPAAKPALLKVGLVVDAADAAAAVRAVQRGQVKTPTGATVAGMALAAVVAGAVALGQQPG